VLGRLVAFAVLALLVLERGHPQRYGGVAFVIEFDAGAAYVLDGAAVEVIREDLAGGEAVCLAPWEVAIVD
jgi:hypothetical protein